MTGDNPYGLSWTKYTGDYFGYYEVLRSETTTEPAYPPNGDTVVRFTITDINKLTFTDTAKAGHTYHYRVVVWTDQTFASVGGLTPACVVAGTLLAVSNIETRTAPPRRRQRHADANAKANADANADADADADTDPNPDANPDAPVGLDLQTRGSRPRADRPLERPARRRRAWRTSPARAGRKGRASASAGAPPFRNFTDVLPLLRPP